MADLQIDISPSEALSIFRRIVRVAVEAEATGGAEALSLLKREGEEIGVHRLDVEQVLQEAAASDSFNKMTRRRVQESLRAQQATQAHTKEEHTVRHQMSLAQKDLQRKLSLAETALCKAEATILQIRQTAGASILVVSQDGRGHYRTISEALRNAAPGAHIAVKPGTYHEGLLLDKLVDIAGDGPSEQIIVESRGSSCVVMRTAEATVRRLTLRCRAGATSNLAVPGKDARESCYGVSITQGLLTLEECDISSDTFACIGVHGQAARPVIRHCSIHSGQLHGISVCDSGRALIDDCDIFSNLGTGIVARQGGNARVRCCRIHDNQKGAVAVQYSSDGTVEYCGIFRNGKSAVEIDGTSSATVTHCQVSDNGENGVYLEPGGTSLIQDCGIADNGHAGVRSKGSARLAIKNCRINRNWHEAVSVSGRGKAIVEACDLTNNARGAFAIEAGCEVVKRGNRV